VNRLAVVEDQVELLCQVKEKLSSKMKAPIATEIVVSVYTMVNNWMMNATINTQQNERYANRQQQADEPASVAQKNYAQDLGIDYPDNITKKKLSDLIKQKVDK